MIPCSARMGAPVNLRPDLIGKRLIIERHGQAKPTHDRLIEHLCAELKRIESLDPGIERTLFFSTS